MLLLLILCSAPYTAADLESLERDHSWVELSLHLGDVPPAARDAKWRTLAEKTLLALLEDASTSGDVLGGVSYAESLLDLYPSLRASSAIMERRAELGIVAFTRCFDAGWADRCGEAMTSFVAKDPERTELAFAAGKLARRAMKSWYAVSFFRKGIDATGPSCADEDVHLAVMSALELPEGEGSAPYIADARAIAKRCFGALRAEIEQGVADSSYVRVNACPVVQTQMEVGKITKRICDAK